MELINQEKAVNAILYFAKNVKYLGKTKLFKLLYYLDFTHFKQTGKSVTGYDYFAWDHGPVPKSLYEELCTGKLTKELKSQIKIVMLDMLHEVRAKAEPKLSVFSRREQKILEELSKVFYTAKAEDMEKESHRKGHPWDRTVDAVGKYRQIDYFLALDNTGATVSKDEAQEKQERLLETTSLICNG